MPIEQEIPNRVNDEWERSVLLLSATAIALDHRARESKLAGQGSGTFLESSLGNHSKNDSWMAQIPVEFSFEARFGWHEVFNLLLHVFIEAQLGSPPLDELDVDVHTLLEFLELEHA